MAFHLEGRAATKDRKKHGERTRLLPEFLTLIIPAHRKSIACKK
jgi:hypothetical protein